MGEYRKRIRLYIDKDQFVIAEVGVDNIGVKVGFGGKIYRDGEDFAVDNYYECFVTKDQELKELLKRARFSVSSYAPQKSYQQGVHVTLPVDIARALALEASNGRTSRSKIIVETLRERYRQDKDLASAGRK